MAETGRWQRQEDGRDRKMAEKGGCRQHWATVEDADRRIEGGRG